MPSELDRLVYEVQDYWGLRRKQPIGKLVTILRGEGFQCPHVLSSIGEDAAAIDLGGQNLILLTTDAIVPELAASNPYVAGYAAIMVNVNDIYAAAGRPIVAMVNVAFTAMEAGVQMMQGICEAGRKFRVQVVRGHTTPDAPANGVSASICGVVNRQDYISAGGARNGDSLILAVDLDGRPSPNYRFGWDTTVLKSSEAVMHRYEAMRILGAKKLLHASKDLSNGGIIGTLLLLLEYARRGATVNLASIPCPADMDLTSWLKMYISTGFVVTSDPKQAQRVLELFHQHDLTAAVIGTVDNSLKTVLELGGETRQIFDFARDSIVAPPEPPQLRCLDGSETARRAEPAGNLGVNKRKKRL